MKTTTETTTNHPKYFLADVPQDLRRHVLDLCFKRLWHEGLDLLLQHGIRHYTSDDLISFYNWAPTFLPEPAPAVAPTSASAGSSGVPPQSPSASEHSEADKPPALQSSLTSDHGPSAAASPKAEQRTTDDRLLTDLRALISRFVVLPEFAAEALALWVVHTYAFTLREVTTYIGVVSPEKRCGKTTLLELLARLANRALTSANITPSALFKVIEEASPTLLIDEADTFLQARDEFAGILNAGYRKDNAYVVRVADGKPRRGRTSYTSPQSATPNHRSADILSAAASELVGRDCPVGRDLREAQRSNGPDGVCPGSHSVEPSHVAPTSPSAGSGGVPPHSPSAEHPNADKLSALLPFDTTDPGPLAADLRSPTSGLVRYSCWCPKVMAAIGRLPDTLADRCILITMQRKMPGEKCERLRRLNPAEFRRRCADFVREHADAIAHAQPDIPSSLNDRAADIWEPLFAIADLAGGQWPALARQAALKLSGIDDDITLIGYFLADIRNWMIHQKLDRLLSRDIVAVFNPAHNRPWEDLRRGREINEYWLAGKMRELGIRPKHLRVGDAVARGYLLDDVESAFRRYVSNPDNPWTTVSCEPKSSIPKKVVV